jgi:hypothetical protein
MPSKGYRIGTLLGQGGMGLVYRAEDVAAQRTVALKLLRADACPSILGRFVIEARSLAALEHPNVVRLYDFIPHPRDPFLVMEFVDGVPLSKHILDGGLTPAEAVRLVAAAARGVQAAHQEGVVHRDVKPQNILVTPGGVAKVVDFGLAKRVDHDDTVTQPGQVVGGTPGFMAPEQATGETPCDARTDVWGLGATLYTALVGKPPFPTGAKNSTRVLTDPVVPPRESNRDVPPDLDAVVGKCLEKDADRRYQSAAELADDLDRWLAGRPTAARPLGWAGRAWRRARRAPRSTVTAWAMTTAALLAVVLVTLTTPGTPPQTASASPDPLAALRAEFAADRLVTLVPGDGLPRWHEWVVGKSGVVAATPYHERAAYIEPIGVGAVKLFDPPGDRYRAEFELRHLKSATHEVTADVKVGVFLAYRRADLGGGRTADSYLAVGFRDSDPGRLKGPPSPQRVAVVLQDYHYRRPGQVPDNRRRQLQTEQVRFDPPGSLPPGAWRRVAAEVTAERVRVYWQADPAAENPRPELVCDLTADQIREHLTEFRKASGNRAAEVNPGGLRSLPTDWHPTGGFGVWADQAGLAFRNVTVRRLPPE